MAIKQGAAVVRRANDTHAVHVRQHKHGGDNAAKRGENFITRREQPDRDATLYWPVGYVTFSEIMLPVNNVHHQPHQLLVVLCITVRESLVGSLDMICLTFKHNRDPRPVHL
jgi:hypothetical protein